MSQAKEQEIKFQFLEEAQEYLEQIESGLLGISIKSVEINVLDAILRAAHSLKGGSAMMGFETLSHLAHSLEDFLKVLKGRKNNSISAEVETLLLKSVDSLRKIVAFNRQKTPIDASFLEGEVEPIFAQLHDLIGEPQLEETVNLASAEVGEDMTVLLFESEVESCLTRLEELLQNPESSCLGEEFILTAQELGGLGEMLQLVAFTSLCQSIAQQLTNYPEQTEAIATAAIESWRQAQAMVITGQSQAIPNQLTSTPELDELPQETQDLLASLEMMEEETEDPTGIILPASLESESTPQIPVKEEQTIRIPVTHLEQIGELFSEMTIERNGLELQLKRLRSYLDLLKKRVQFLEQSNFQLRTTYDRSLGNALITKQTTIPVYDQSEHFTDWLEMDRYSDLHALSVEVMEKIVQIQEVTNDLTINLDDTEAIAKDLKRTSKLMQNKLTQVRMRPLSDLLKRFPRALRDMSLEYGKQVELQVKGGSTLIEKTILESLSEPLLHLLRNAFDHGIEDPLTRKQQGKPETGTIAITASYRGNRTVITVSDDGQGINLEQIRERAKQMGWSPEKLAQAGEKELLGLIFEPGFTTATTVTDLSGRGIGMDIVRNNIYKIQGDIQVNTKPGQGTTFIITVPFTLSVVQVFLVESKGMLLAFPTNATEELLILDPQQIITNAGQEVLNWEGYLVPLIRLSQWLQFSHERPVYESEAVPLINQPVVLLIAIENKLMGIQVDRYWEEQEVTIRQVEGLLSMPPGFSGCTILGDGRVVPLVDAINLLQWIEESTDTSYVPQFAEPIIEQPPSEKSMVMIVDDSINVRRFLALTLEKAGYRVEQAKDGQDALEKLQVPNQITAVICDIEMPRLDGYGFLAHLKSDPQFKQLPVIMLTSRSGEKHRKLAFSLGASAYFSKPFKEQELLATLQELIPTN